MRNRQKTGTTRRRLLQSAPLGLTWLVAHPAQALTNESTDLRPTLRSVAAIVLPKAALGEEGFEATLSRFEAWSEGFEPVAELDHAYLWTDELQFGPSDPRPAWRSQLEGFELESQRRWGASFHDAGDERQRRLIDRALDSVDTAELPFAAEAPHIALGLMAWFFSTSQANDLCYEAAIGRHECRGLPDAVLEPTRRSEP